MRATAILALFWLGSALVGCKQASREPATVRYTYSWNEDRPKTRALLKQFSQETGIQVKTIPIPEYTRDYLQLAQKLLKDGSGTDVLNIDVIWSPILEPHLLDLRPYLAAEIPQIEPELLSSYTVNGKLVAVPFNVPVGTLEYRKDLLRQYGYDHPPKTWDELERMATKIQAGQRRKGVKDFWGYVWQGAAGEALTCNALEWQIAAGGGRIIEKDRTISVNNPAAIQAWQRARHWIGRISPPGVLAYREVDSMLVFDAGKAAFNRVWFLTPMTKSGRARGIGWRSFHAPVAETGFSTMPEGVGGSAGTLGGTGTAISINSTHRNEAVALVRSQLHALMQDASPGGPPQSEFSGPSPISDPRSTDVAPGLATGIVARPSLAAGSKYKQVSRAYIDSVHSVLTGERIASDVAASLEKQLVEITGFQTGPPKTGNTTVLERE